jgi:hypothetical protein
MDNQRHIVGISEAEVSRRYIRQAFDNFFSVPKCEIFFSVPKSDGTSSIIAFSSTAVRLQFPQGGTFFETTTSTAKSEAESSIWRSARATTAHAHRLQCSDASGAEESFFFFIAHIVRKALLEVSVLVTSARYISTKRSCEFRHEPTSGEVEERGQENKSKLHC